MKSFIGFLGALLLASLCFTYAGDYNFYMHEQRSLKAIAEECAAGATLALDFEEYANGYIVFDEEKAVSYVEKHFQNYIENIARCEILGTEYEVEISDDKKSHGDSLENPSIIVTLKVKTKDIMRLKNIEITELCRVAKYEIKKKGDLPKP